MLELDKKPPLPNKELTKEDPLGHSITEKKTQALRKKEINPMGVSKLRLTSLTF